MSNLDKDWDEFHNGERLPIMIFDGVFFLMISISYLSIGRNAPADPHQAIEAKETESRELSTEEANLLKICIEAGGVFKANPRTGTQICSSASQTSAPN